MMPKATLLGQPWETRTMVFGRKRFIFRGEEGRVVPVAVALTLQKLKAENGKPLFRVEGLPAIVKPIYPAVEPRPPAQNEVRNPKQRKLAGWH